MWWIDPTLTGWKHHIRRTREGGRGRAEGGRGGGGGQVKGSAMAKRA